MKKKAIKKIHRRNENTHKGDYGHAFIVAGSTGMTGAAYLASQAAILSGCGLVTLGIPANLNQVMEIKLTEVMTLPLACSKEGYLKKSSEKNILNFSKKVSAVAIGPGLSRLSEVENLVRKVLLKVNKPLVLDADGLNALSKNTQLLKKEKCLQLLLRIRAKWHVLLIRMFHGYKKIGKRLQKNSRECIIA